jgi:hypothetical protein
VAKVAELRRFWGTVDTFQLMYLPERGKITQISADISNPINE